MPMQGLTLKSLNHHYALYPLFGSLVAGCVLAGWYIVRLNMNLDATWRRNKNPYPWQVPANYQMKFISVGAIDYKNLTHPRPDY